MLAIAGESNPAVPLHRGDMVDFDLGHRFDVVLCLGSSIGCVKTGPQVREAIVTLARTAVAGGVVVVEPCFPPQIWETGRVTADLVKRPDLKVARILVSGARGSESNRALHSLPAPHGQAENVRERHELGLFAHDAYVVGFDAAGPTVADHGTGACPSRRTREPHDAKVRRRQRR